MLCITTKIALFSKPTNESTEERMKTWICPLFALLMGMALVSPEMQAQQPQKPPTPSEMAEKEAARLEKLLNLEFHQVFYVDSILQHDMQAMMDEIEQMHRDGMQEMSSYRIVQDRWKKQIETAYQRIFTPEQWEKYLIDSGQKKSDKKKSREERRRQREQERIRRNQEE